MKTNIKLKSLAIILGVILLTLISFFGLYVKNGWQMKNLIPDYSFGMLFNGYKTVTYKVDTSEEDVPVEDPEEDPTVHEEEGHEHPTQKIPVNLPEVITAENFEKSKKAINKRLNLQNASEYTIRQNNSDGTILVDLINNDETDSIIQNIYAKGIFEMKDQTDETVYLTNSDVKNARVGYINVETGVTYLVINITFNKDGAKKLEEISSESTEEMVKIVDLYLNGSRFSERQLDAKITNGELSIPIASSEAVDLKLIEPEVKYMADLIKSEPLQISYVISDYIYTQPMIDSTVLMPIAIMVVMIFAVIAVYLVRKYKLIGIFNILNTITYISILLIVIRITNSSVTEFGIFAIVLSVALEMLLSIKLLNSITNTNDIKAIINDKIIEFTKITCPLIIISIVFAFMTWLPVNSFGSIMFWGFVINILLTITLGKAILLTFKDVAKGGKK